MREFTNGFWGTLDHSLQCIGKRTARLFTRSAADADEVTYAALGGCLICALLGAAIGFALSDLSRDIALAGGALLGLLIGACMGVFFGSFVEAVDEYIRNLLSTFKLR